MVDLDWSKRAMESIPLSSEDQMEKGREGVNRFESRFEFGNSSLNWYVRVELESVTS